MKASTTIRMVGGTWYIRVPPTFAEHLGLKEEAEDSIVPGEIQDETSKHGNYISAWKTPQKKGE
jgi:hypothetical protein